MRGDVVTGDVEECRQGNVVLRSAWRIERNSCMDMLEIRFGEACEINRGAKAPRCTLKNLRCAQPETNLGHDISSL
jgi:hypothetical protein